MIKKYFSALVILLVLPLSSCAQWYLFPGGKANTTVTEEKAVTTVKEPADTASVAETELTGREHESSQDSQNWLFPSFSRNSSINLTMILPVGSVTGRTNSNYLEMYCGALLALRDLGNEGARIRVNLVDSSAGFPDPYTLSNSDVIIGPVSYSDVNRMSGVCPDGKYLISPLDHRTADLVERGSVIHAPTSWEYQIDELVDWLSSDCLPGDNVIVVKDNSESGFGEQAAYLMEKLEASGTAYRTVSSVDDIRFERGRNYRISVASDSDAFLTGAVRAAALASKAKDGTVYLYCTSRIRSTISANVTDLHDANTRLTAGYYIDYESDKVRDFILAYRALYGSEPGSFAFQGYDAVHYFVSACRMGGHNWAENLPRYSERGLQSDFKFDRWQKEGKANTGVRRVVYNNDLSTELL